MATGWLPRVDGLPRAYWYLWVGTLVNRLGGFVVPFLAIYLTQERHVAPEEAGLIIGGWGTGALTAGPVGGFLADRVGRRTTMLLGLGLGAASMLHLGFARAPWHIAIAAFLLGALSDLWRPAMNAAVADVVPPEDRARAYSLIYWAVNLGFAIATTIAGLMARVSFLALFVGDAVTTLGFATVVWLRVPETHPHLVEHAATPPERPRATDVYRDRVFMWFVLAQLLVAVVFNQSQAALAIDMKSRGVPESQYGLLIALNGLLIVTVQPFVTERVQGMRRARVLAVSALLVGGGFAMSALAHGAALYAASITVWTMGEVLFSPITPTIVADLSPRALRGSYQGVFQMSWGIAACVGPVIGTLVLGRLGSLALWLGCLGVGIAAAVLHLAIAPARRRRLLAIHGDEVAAARG